MLHLTDFVCFCSLTGWKLGWAYGPDHLMENLRVAHQNCTYMCQTPEQEAVAAALEQQLDLTFNNPASFFSKLRSELGRKREFWKNVLTQAGWTPVVPEGGYFMLANWTNMEPKADISGDTGPEDLRLIRWLAKNWKLHAVPPSAFCSEQSRHLMTDFIRFNFYKKDETLEMAKEVLLRHSKKTISN